MGVAALIACSFASGQGLAADQKVLPAGGTITIRSLSDFDCFDPARCLGSGTLAGLYATLLSVDDTGKVIPYLATSWDVTPTSITFKLRDDATCADGTKITPTVVMKSYQRLIEVKSKNNVANFGAGPYSVKADDAAGTFTFETETPYSDLVYGFTDVYPGLQSAIVCPAGYADPNEKMNSQAFGAGPYQLVEVVHGDHATVKLRPEFNWGPAGRTSKSDGVPDTVIYKVVVNQSTAANLLISGGLDAASVQGPDVDRLMADPNIAHRVNYSQLLDFLHFNESPGHVTNDPVVRQALITAIDPAAVNQAETNGQGKLSKSWFLGGTVCYDPDTDALAPTPSVDAARDVLIKAGWKYENGTLTKDGKPLAIRFTYANWFGPGPEYMQAIWTEMGVQVTNSSAPMTSWVSDSYINGNFDASLNQPAPPIPLHAAWKTRLTGTFPPPGTNWPRTDDPALNEAAAKAVSTVGDESCKYWGDFQKQLWKGWHILPLYAVPLNYFSKNLDISHGMTGSTDLGFSPIWMRRLGG